MAVPEFTAEQLYEQAQGNVTAFIVGALAFLKQQGQQPEQLISFLGKQFTPPWLSLRDQGARAAMEQLVLNFLSGGGELVSFSGDENSAEAVMANWPAAGYMELFGLAWKDVDPFFNIFHPIARDLGLNYTWHRDGDHITFRFAH